MSTSGVDDVARGSAGYAGVGLVTQQLTRLVGQHLANIIPLPVPAIPMQASVSQFHSLTVPPHSGNLVDSSTPSVRIQFPPWSAFVQQSPLNRTLISLCFVLPVHSIFAEIPQRPVEQTLRSKLRKQAQAHWVWHSTIGDMSGMQVVLGANANSIATAVDSERSLNSIAEVMQFDSYNQEDVTMGTADCLERRANEMLLKPTQIRSALTIPTPL